MTSIKYDGEDFEKEKAQEWATKGKREKRAVGIRRNVCQREKKGKYGVKKR